MSDIICEKNPACYDTRDWCMAKNGGRCTILRKTYVKDGACPFYKKYALKIKENDKK